MFPFHSAASSSSLLSSQSRPRQHRTMPILLLLSAVLHPATATRHIPFGYQSNSALTPTQRRDTGARDPSSFAGSIQYDPLHHALYMTGVTFSNNTFDGNDPFDLQHEQDGWDLGLSSYTPKNGDCFYSVFKLPVDRQPWGFQPGNAIQTGITLMHSRRFGSRTSAEACSAVDILPANVNEEGLGGYLHEFESLSHYNEFPPTTSPKPSSSTYYPTYAPSGTARPTIARGVVPEEWSPKPSGSSSSLVSVTPDDIDMAGDLDTMDKAPQGFTTSNIARKVRIYHDNPPEGIISFREVEIYDTSFNNVAIGKTATQSTDYSQDHVAFKAVDGDVNTFSHTASDAVNSWWEVDLGSSVTVSSIKIWNRNCANTNCLGRISYATLDLLDESGTAVATRNFGDTSAQEEIYFDFSFLDATPSQASPSYSPTYLPSKQPTGCTLDDSNDFSISNVAQKVRIQLPACAGPGQLGIREVEIWDDNSVNVARGKFAIQSSDWNADHLASFSVDGDYETFSDTVDEVSAWWEVDLGQPFKITAVTIFNRYCKEDSETDACLGRMSYSTLYLIDGDGYEVASRNIGDTSAKENIDLDFCFMPTASDPPVATPVVAASFPPVLSSIPPMAIPVFSGSQPPVLSSEPPMAIPAVASNPPVFSSKPPMAPRLPGTSSYSPTYLPIVTAKPTAEQPSAGNRWSARKVRIELPGIEGSGPLSLVEVEVNEVVGDMNYALGKPAIQSSDESSGDHPASKAVDLDKSYSSYSQTAPEDVDAWWEVDLEDQINIAEIVIYNLNCSSFGEDDCLGRLSYALVFLFDDQGRGVAELNLGDVSAQEIITLRPTSESDIPARELLADEVHSKSSRELPPMIPMETLSVRLLIAGHVESINYNDGYIVQDLTDGQYDQANVYGFTQQVDIRLPLGGLMSGPDFMNDFQIMENPNANVNGLGYSLEEASLGGFVTSGIDAKALLNDHLPVSLNTLYPVSLVADATSKKHYYVLILASDNAELNDDGVDSELHQDTTIGSGANQQSWTDFQDLSIAGIIDPDDFFGKKGRPKYGSSYRIVLKKMAIDNVDPSCVTDAVRRGERQAQWVSECKQFSSIEKSLSSTSYMRDTIVMSQQWVQEFTPDFGEDTRPSALLFAPSDNSNSPDLLVMSGSTSGYGAAFGTAESPDDGNFSGFDLDGFIMKIRADTGSFAGKDAFDASTNSFTNTHSLRISSLPNKHDVVASLCADPLREWGTPEPQDHVFVVGSTEGLLPGLADGLRDESFTQNYPEEAAVNSMEAFLMKVNLVTMNTVWTVQVAGINLVSQLRGNAFGFGCAVTHDGMDVYLTGLVKDGGVVTDFSANALTKHDNVARGGTDVFVAKYKTSDGTLNYLRQIGSTKDDTPSRGNGGITVDRIGNAIIVGNTRGSLMRKRDVAEYMFGQDESDAASDIFIMSLERDTGEYAPISEDSVTPVIAVDNSGLTHASDSEVSSATNQEAANATGSSAASIFLIVVLVLFLTGAVMGTAVFAYKSRKLRQQKSREAYGNFNLSPRGESNLNARKRSAWGLHGKPGGSVLNHFDDLNIMVEVRNSSSGGWHGVYDDEALHQIDFGSSRAVGQDDVIEQSLFMEDGLQALEDIESRHNNRFSIGGEDDDEDEEDVTDEDLIQAYNEAMALDIEPESDAVAALTNGLNMPNLGSGLT